MSNEISVILVPLRGDMDSPTQRLEFLDNEHERAMRAVLEEGGDTRVVLAEDTKERRNEQVAMDVFGRLFWRNSTNSKYPQRRTRGQLGQLQACIVMDSVLQSARDELRATDYVPDTIEHAMCLASDLSLSALAFLQCHQSGQNRLSNVR